MRFLLVALLCALSYAQTDYGRFNSLMDDLTGQDFVGGMYCIADFDGNILSEYSTGYSNVATEETYRSDTIVKIAAKAVTIVAMLALVDQGLLSLDDPISTWFPHLSRSELSVWTGEVNEDGSLVTEPAEREITVRMLAAHTEGWGYGLWEQDPQGFMLRSAVTGQGSDSLFGWAENVNEVVGSVPLRAQPGELWTYGIGVDLIGEILEVIKGKDLDSIVREIVLDPLRMDDTSFSVPEHKQERVATAYVHNDQGELVPWEGLGMATLNAVRFGDSSSTTGGTGLFSTLHDYTQFVLMLANFGTHPQSGVKILEEETARLGMQINELGEGMTIKGHTDQAAAEQPRLQAISQAQVLTSDYLEASSGQAIIGSLHVGKDITQWVGVENTFWIVDYNNHDIS